MSADRPSSEPRPSRAPLGDVTTNWDESSVASPTPPRDAELTPGTVLLDRYRILEALGSGGMGTVYRADDLRLGQRVALKFVAPRGPGGADLVAAEVRVARRVSHPNVCRVHDLGEVDGRTFISMEFVDGEDLEALQRRIGRLPADKATQIARQVCAGLQAAHEQGVLHRDLKPGNVMLDRRGDAKLADFGIAAALDSQAEGPSGTPAYMAPELFAGGPASAASDIFSLGVLLWELFTGERLFRATTMTELLKQHRESVDPPSRRVPDLDPRVERAIMWCLRRDPDERPRSPLAVLAALPGGDPLAEALAAGQTPSPQLVAAAGGTGRLNWREAWPALAVVLAACALLGFADSTIKLIPQLALPRSPQVLEDRARTILAEVGVEDAGRARANGFELDRALVRARTAERPRRADWERIVASERPPLLHFWYRQVPPPAVLRAQNVKGRVTWDDPPPIIAGAARVKLAPSGALRELYVVPDAWGSPPPPSTDAPAPAAADFRALFDHAGIDPADLRATTPAFVPPTFADARHAWEGPPVADGAPPLRVEAASFAGRPVAFAVFDGPRLLPEAPRRTWRFLARTLLVLATVVLAWRSLRRRRADARGAVQVGLTTFCLVVAFTVLTGDHSSGWTGVGELAMKGMSHGLAIAAELALYYLALEPHVRRLWPETMISWSRLLAGDLRDPHVGRSILMGVAMGCVTVMIVFSGFFVARLLDWPEPAPVIGHTSSIEVLSGTGAAFGTVLEMGVDLARESMAFFMALVVLRLILRSSLLAAVVNALVWSLVWWGTSPTRASLAEWIVPWVISVLAATTVTVTAVRFGLLAMIAGYAAFSLLASFPVQPDLSVWYANATLLPFGLVLGAAAYGAWVSVRGRAVPA
jgi:serine/threonine-protein kinase